MYSTRYPRCSAFNFFFNTFLGRWGNPYFYYSNKNVFQFFNFLWTFSCMSRHSNVARTQSYGRAARPCVYTAGRVCNPRYSQEPPTLPLRTCGQRERAPGLLWRIFLVRTADISFPAIRWIDGRPALSVSIVFTRTKKLRFLFL